MAVIVRGKRRSEKDNGQRTLDIGDEGESATGNEEIAAFESGFQSARKLKVGIVRDRWSSINSAFTWPTYSTEHAKL